MPTIEPKYASQMTIPERKALARSYQEIVAAAAKTLADQIDREIMAHYVERVPQSSNK